ncbi:MAG: hypothetical protein DCC65_13315 [Planctomycetota bacterium]|nr:MAG: hypothetical protein DCC65_13315 [Planctomycetota bacterium]
MNEPAYIVAAAQPVMIGLTGIIVLGGAAQWLAWRLRLPSILLLLICGFVAGPVTNFVSPDEMFGGMLRPFVAISVALILFEGGLSLDFSELRGQGVVVRNLVTLGLLATWVIAAAAAYLVVGLEFQLAVLLGAILTVTGPTVIQPMLRYIRPQGPVGAILKWEGIVIDPIGALLAVLVFEVLLGGRLSDAPAHFAIGLLKTVVIGGGLGYVAARLLATSIINFWIPQYLQNSVAITLVVTAFVGANLVQPESGLLAVTIMGIVLGNQKRADIRHIVEFKENLRVLLIAALFIILSARLTLDDLRSVGPQSILFVLIMIFVARPLCVLVSTLGSSLQFRERLFLSWMAPRGIVAASVASIFALDLEQKGFSQARLLIPMTFAVIVCTVLLYGLTAAPLARRLGLAERDPQGALLLGAHPFGVALAKALMESGFKVLVVDNNPSNISAARLTGVPTYLGSILGERTIDDLNLAGIGRILAMTPNDHVNVLAVQRFSKVFGMSEAYQFVPRTRTPGRDDLDKHLQGRLLFNSHAAYTHIEERLARGDVVKVTNLTASFDYAAFNQMYGADTLPLCVIRPENKLLFETLDKAVSPQPGDKIVALVRPTGQTQAA